MRNPIKQFNNYRAARKADAHQREIIAAKAVVELLELSLRHKYHQCVIGVNFIRVPVGILECYDFMLRGNGTFCAVHRFLRSANSLHEDVIDIEVLKEALPDVYEVAFKKFTTETSSIKFARNLYLSVFGSPVNNDDSAADIVSKVARLVSSRSTELTFSNDDDRIVNVSLSGHVIFKIRANYLKLTSIEVNNQRLLISSRGEFKEASAIFSKLFGTKLLRIILR